MSVINAYSIALQSGIPTILWGDPGVGKTAITMQMAETAGLPIEVVIASIREPSDFGGLPIIVDGGVKLSPPGWALRLADGGILFIDELTTAAPAVQAACLRVIHDRVVGDIVLPDNVMIAAAANPPGIAAGGWELSAPLSNRMLHLEFQLDSALWRRGFIEGFPAPNYTAVPDGWRDGLMEQRALVASFINARPELLMRMPEDSSSQGLAWPSPRSWDMVATATTAAKASGADEDTQITLVQGCVGNGPGSEYITYIINLDLPDPEEVLKGAAKFKFPPEGDKQYAILSSVMTCVVRIPTEERWKQGWKLLEAAAVQGLADVGAVCCGPMLRLIETKDRGGAGHSFSLPETEILPYIPLLQKAGALK